MKGSMDAQSVEGQRISRLTQVVTVAAGEVHRALGPGLVKVAYTRALAHELATAGADFAAEVEVPVTYKGIDLACTQRVDLVVGGAVVVVVHTVTTILPHHVGQATSFLRLLGAPVGVLVNFEASTFKNGVRRRVNPSGPALLKAC